MSKRQQRRRASRRRHHALVAGGGMALVATLGTGTAEAATFTVTNTGDTGAGSLRAAVAGVEADTTDTAAPGDSIVFASGVTGTINLTTTGGGQLYTHRPVQIFGPGADKLTVHAAPSSRVLDVKGGPARVSGLTITGGAASASSPGGAYGGGIYSKGDLELDQVVITGNTSTKDGGGLLTYKGAVTINGSTISGNSAAYEGGGVEFFVGTGGSAVINGSTFTGNSVTGSVANTAGEAFYAGVPVQLNGSTVAGNLGPSDGGQIYMFSAAGQLTAQDSVIAGNGTVPDLRITGSASATAAFSLIRDTTPTSSGTAITTDATDKTAVDPLLGPLASNGGPTPTMAPQPNSPVLDQGKSFGLTSDQRGLSRPFALPISSVPAGGDRSDIGAVEEHTPAVAGLSPSTGATGTHVTITGTGFSGASKVMFGSAPASSFTVINDATIVAVAPASNGAVDVRVIGPYGESPVVGADRFTFPAFKPTLSGKRRGKLRGRKLNTGETVGCTTGGSSCSFSFKVLDHKLKLGTGTFTLNAGRSRTLKLKLKKRTLHKLKGRIHHKQFKVTLTVIAREGSGAPITFKQTIKIKT